jgi:multimeric flavodoxin WrbA
MDAMKRILGIIGSPRKYGNTDVLVSRILEGARDHGASTERVSLADLKISECDGCYACWKGKHACSKADDMRDLYPRIAKADAIVFGTPVYWFGPTAIMKCFMDRFVYFTCPANRRKIRNKVGVIAVPFGDRTYAASDPVVDFFTRCLDYLEMRLIDKILVPGVTEPGEVRTREPVMAKCHDLGRRLAMQERSR